MDLPKISLDDMKSKFGLSSNASGYERRSSRRNDYADDYDGYDDGYNDGYGDSAGSGYGQDAYGLAASEYEPYNQVTTRASGSRRSSYSAPRLVSATDVRASTRYTGSSASSSVSSYRKPGSTSSSTYRRSGSSSSFRTLVDGAQPAPSSPAEVNARKNQMEESASLYSDPISSPTVVPATASLGTSRSMVSASSPVVSASPVVAPKSTLTLQDSLAAAAAQRVHTPTRSLEVLTPLQYNDVERVAKILRAGDVAVLDMRETPEGLVARVLDFSFGVACALDATVDYVGTKVFVIMTGTALSDAERMQLQSRGVL